MPKRKDMPKYGWLITLSIIVVLLMGFGSSGAQTWKDIGDTALSDYDPGGNLSLAISSANIPYISFLQGTIDGEVGVMKYVGGSWSYVGHPGVSPAGTNLSTMAIDTGGMPYIAYVNFLGGDEDVSVMRYADTGWQYVGSEYIPGLSSIVYLSMAIGNTGIPYVFANSGVVQYTTGSGWTEVGGTIVGNVAGNSIVTDSNGLPLVAYGDASDSDKVTVKRFNGSSWVTVGAPGFSTNGPTSISLALAGDGTPYVAFSDHAHHGGCTVMKYTSGSGWVTVGSPGFSDSVLKQVLFYEAHISLVINKTGRPSVAFTDAALGCVQDVMTFNGSGWISLGNSNFSLRQTEGSRIAIDTNGIPYVAYFSDSTGAYAYVDRLTAPDITGRDTVCSGAEITLTDSLSGGTWSSSTAVLATVNSSTGIVSGLAPGTDTIMYSYSGLASAIRIIDVGPTLPNAGLITATSDSVCKHDTLSLHDTVSGGEWMSGNTSVATVSTAGVIRGIESGIDTVYYVVSNLCGADTARFVVAVNLGSCIEVVSNIVSAAILVYPNPAEDLLNISGIAQLSNYKLLNAVGITVGSGKLNTGNNSVSLGGLSSGLYLLQIEDQQGLKRVCQIVKE